MTDNKELMEHIIQESQALQSFQAQAQRYMSAVYGPSVGFRAPETFDNILERWILAVGMGVPGVGFAEECMSTIERMAADPARGRRTW
jgi:hypothetical protein